MSTQPQIVPSSEPQSHLKNGVYRTYDATDGLPGGVTSLCQDSRGYLWVGSAVGLYRFDGASFRLDYLADDGTSTSIQTICEDRQGRLWFARGWEDATAQGVICYDPVIPSVEQRFTTYTANDGLVHDTVLAVCEDERGDLWFGTRAGASRFDGDTFTTYGADKGLVDDRISAISRDAHGNIWFATMHGVYCYNHHAMRSLDTATEFRNGEVYAIYNDTRGNVWMGARDNLVCWDGFEYQTYTAEDGFLSGGSIMSIIEDRRGNIWIGGWGQGLSCFDPETRCFSNFTSNNGLPANGIVTLLEDQEGNLWAGDIDAGLICINAGATQILTDEPVTSVFFQSRSDQLWFSNARNLYGLSLDDYSEHTLSPGSAGQGVPLTDHHFFNSHLDCGVEDPEGNIWIGSYDITKDSRIEVHSFGQAGILQNYSTASLLGTSDDTTASVTFLIKARDGTIWAGTGSRHRQAHLCRFDGETFSAIPTPHLIIHCLFEDRRGRIWIGGRGKSCLSCYDPSKESESDEAIEDYSQSHGFSEGYVYTILEDDNGLIWLGTQFGLYGMDPLADASGTEVHIADYSTQGLGRIVHSCSAKDARGHLWFGTMSGGIYRTDGRHFQQFTEADGLPSNSVTGLAPRPDGTMLIGTRRGIIRYHPTLTTAPPVEIREVIADQVYESPADLALSTSIAKFLFISFHGTSFATHRMRYSYILEGYEEAWRHTWDHQVRYEDLPPGDYTFKVIAINRDLVSSATPAELKLTIQPDPMEQRIAELESDRERLRAENVYLQEEIKLDHNFEEIISQSKALGRILKRVEQVAATDATVLILGETGTGKELLARAVHNISGRKDRPLVKINCATLPEHLIESELFGHEKGAFTGALSRKIGRFELADGGTIFLDEIGDLPLELQSKLLRVLQEGEFERLGSSRMIKVDVRVMAATSRDLEEAIEQGAFREDLYYRLHVFPLEMPPLRVRRDDIPLLVRHFVQKYSARLGKTIEQVPQDVMDALANYDWPGNVRELEHVIERAVIISPDENLSLEDWLPKQTSKPDATGIPTLEDLERQHIREVLELTGWRIRGPRGAAGILGLKPTTLEARMAKLGLRRK